MADNDSEEYKEMQAEKARLRVVQVMNVEVELEEERPITQAEMKEMKNRILEATRIRNYTGVERMLLRRIESLRGQWSTSAGPKKISPWLRLTKWVIFSLPLFSKTVPKNSR